MALQHIRSSTANKRANPASLADGQIAINTNNTTPGIFFKDSNGNLVKTGPVHVGSGAPNAVPASGGTAGNSLGEQWLDNSNGDYTLKTWDGSAWREIVVVSGMIKDGTIANSDINAAAGIVYSKLSLSSGIVNTDISASAAIALSKLATGALPTGITVSSGNIVDGTITNADVNASAAIAYSKLALSSGIVNTDINASAAIAGTKISPDFGSQNVVTTGTNTAASFIPTSSGVPTNGLYLPAANSVAISTNGTQRLTVDTAATTSTLPVVHPLGAVGTPSITFTGDLNTGFWSPTADTLAASTGGSERLRILSDGKVGLGTSSPATLLHLSSATGTASPTPTELRIATTSNASDWSTVNTWGQLSFYSADTSGSGPKIHAYIGVSAFNSAATCSDLTFATNANASDTLSKRMVIRGDTGNVGIGTTTPTFSAGSGLEIEQSSATSTLRIERTGTGTSALELRADNGFTAIDSRLSNTDLVFSTNATERARIDSSGRLLVGTSTARTGTLTFSPFIQCEGATGAGSSSLFCRHSNSTSGPALLFAKTRGTSNGSSTVVQSNDELGTIYFSGGDDTDIDSRGAQIGAFVDGTPGANDMPGRLVFSTTADGASSPTERMRISNEGRVFFNTTDSSPAVNSVSGTTIGGGLTEISQSSNTVLRINRFGAAPTGTVVDFRNAGTIVGTISTAASSTAYNTSSDYRLKENVVLLTGAIDRLQQIPVHRFNFIADPDTVVDGFIAHEAAEVVPECVTGTKDEVDADGNPVYQGIDQSKLVPLLTAALQEALQKIEDLEARLDAANL
jgi:hypothetical protein